MFYEPVTVLGWPWFRLYSASKRREKTNPTHFMIKHLNVNGFKQNLQKTVMNNLATVTVLGHTVFVSGIGHDWQTDRQTDRQTHKHGAFICTCIVNRWFAAGRRYWRWNCFVGPQCSTKSKTISWRTLDVTAPCYFQRCSVCAWRKTSSLEPGSVSFWSSTVEVYEKPDFRMWGWAVPD